MARSVSGGLGLGRGDRAARCLDSREVTLVPTEDSCRRVSNHLCYRLFGSTEHQERPDQHSQGLRSRRRPLEEVISCQDHLIGIDLAKDLDEIPWMDSLKKRQAA